MKRKRLSKKVISVFLAVLMAMSALVPAFQAFADSGIEEYYNIELFYKDTNQIVPTYDDEENKTEHIEYMTEGDELNLTYQLIDTEMPDNAYIKWYSETPSLVDVTQEGVVKAFDSSKGAVVQSWIDNEVKTIPLVGSIMGKALEKVLFNDKVDLDSMDTDEIIDLVEKAFGSDSILAQWIDSYKGELVDSLRYYLDNINSNIHVQLYAADGTLLDDDYVRVTVRKCEEWYANFLPNGTHITNKSQINTTVAVGQTVQLYAVTTPLRLHYGCVYSVKSSSIFTQGKVVATVTDGGLVTFKNTGKVTIMVSPDTEQIIEGILKLVNYIYALDNTGTLDTDKIAKILIEYLGLDINRAVLAAILDACFAIKDIVGDTADPVQLTATAVEVLSNLILQMVYNDKITFDVVDAQPLTDFSIDGEMTVKEGSQIQLSVKDIQPSAGDTSDITWTSSDPSIASVDPKTGVITGRDAGGAYGNLSSQKCTISATSKANNITKSCTLTVTGKTGKYLSDVEIQGKTYLEMAEETDFTYSVFPKRVADSDNLYITWGIKTGTDEDGNPTYVWATDDTPATDGIGTITSTGHYTATDGGVCTIAVQAKTGYYLSSSNFYEISSFTNTLDVTNGIAIDKIDLSVSKAVGIASSIKSQNTVTVNGNDYTYVTIKAGTQYGGLGAVLDAAVYPENASNQNLKWVVDNTKFYNTSVSDDTHSATVTQAYAHENADTFNIYATSEDGRVKSNVITVCVSKSNVEKNEIDQDSIEVINGKTADVTHTVSYGKGSDGTYSACYKCNWYSSDESVFTVSTKNNDNRDATITAVDVGTATLYCVSADGGVLDSCQVTVYPDKEYLSSIVKLCDKTVVRKNKNNQDAYKEYMGKLDLAYYVLYDDPMSAQNTCDTYAKELLYAFYKVGGFISLTGVNIVNINKTELPSNHITVSVGATTSYKKYSYNFGYTVSPKGAMYSNVRWTSSNSKIVVDKNGKCTPADNEACSSIITCTVTDYMGNESSNSVFLTFARKAVTGISLDTDSIVGGEIGNTKTIKATVTPNGISSASCPDVYWSSNNEEIATVDQNGVVTFKEGGDCIITATTYDGGFTATCAVNVVTNYTELVARVNKYTDLGLNEINYYPDSWKEYTDALEKAKSMISAGDNSQNEVDKMCEELDAAYNGLVKYNYIQKVELYRDGEKTSEFYQYDVSPLGTTFNYKNAVLDLKVRLYPNNASYESVEWSSSTSDITVTEDGKCSPTVNKPCYGSITCTVIDHFGNKYSDSVWVSFTYYPVTKLELSSDSISGGIGTTAQLTCKVYPTGGSLTHIGQASIQDYYWESDDENIASVDQNGLVTFNSAGSTIIRAVSYDGGIYAECVASSDGDRTQLRAAIEKSKDIDYTQYEYSYGMAFKSAYENAQKVMTDNTVSQTDIDNAASALETAYANLAEHPYVSAQKVDVTYKTQKKNTLAGSFKDVTSGSVSDSDALSINLSDSSYKDANTYNKVILTAGAVPLGAMYKSITWNVDESYKMSTSISDEKIELVPDNGLSKGAWAKVTATITDYYDRTTTRSIAVVMSDNVCNGFNITQDSVSIYATAAPTQLEYSLDGSPEFSTLTWTSSNTDVLTVDSNGVITPIATGTAVVTGKTLDGGYSDSVTVNVQTDFTALVAKQNEYYTLIQDVKDSYTYTQDSLENLSAAVSKAQQMVNEGKATQVEVNQMLEELESAYNALVEYVPTTGVSIALEDSTNTTEVNPGYIRYKGSIALNGSTIQLKAVEEPLNSVYTSVEWSSSNPNISVDSNGLVTNDTTSAGAAKITCTVKNVHDQTATASVYVSFVRNGVTGVSLADETVFGAPSKTVTLTPNVTTEGSISTFKDCIYTSDNPDVASVDENGVVTFVTQGEATITVTTLDGGYTATVKAYTTWDTTALKAAIDDSKGIQYTDYAYEYGTAFKTAYDHALEVYNDVYSAQDTINDACTALIEAKNALEGHEFITPVITMLQDSTTVNTGDYISVDSNGNASLSLSLGDGAMYKSAKLEVSDESGLTATVNGTVLDVNKTADRGTLNLKVTVVDDYDREITKSYALTFIDTPIPATAITLTADGAEVQSSLDVTVEGKATNYKDIQFGYVTTPADANSITNVVYTVTPTSYATITNGLLTLTNAGKSRLSLLKSVSLTVVCTVTNLDGTSVSASAKVNITLK